MKMTKQINVLNEFGEFMAGRTKNDSDRSGELFFENILLPNFSENEKLILDFTGCARPAPSFIDEAFRRLYNKIHKDLNNFIEIKIDYSDSLKKIKNVMAGKVIND